MAPPSSTSRPPPNPSRGPMPSPPHSGRVRRARKGRRTPSNVAGPPGTRWSCSATSSAHSKWPPWGLTRTAHSPARADFEEALAMARDAGDPVVIGYTLAHYGTLLRVDGDAARARALHGELLTVARSLGDENLRAEAHYDLAMDAMSPTTS